MPTTQNTPTETAATESQLQEIVRLSALLGHYFTRAEVVAPDFSEAEAETLVRWLHNSIDKVAPIGGVLPEKTPRHRS
jgi:hypothetical protein